MVKNGGGKEVIAQVNEIERSLDSTLETNEYDLFAAPVADDSVGLVLPCAKLRSICGFFETNPRADRKMWKHDFFSLGTLFRCNGARCGWKKMHDNGNASVPEHQR